MHEDQKFKLVYGSTNTIWETATLDDDVDPRLSTTDCGSPKTRKANGACYRHRSGVSVLEMKYQYDNQAVNAVTIAAVPYRRSPLSLIMMVKTAIPTLLKRDNCLKLAMACWFL